MRTSCVRPGCGGPVAAAVLIDRDQHVVVLHPPELSELGSMALCRKHVDRVTTPAGWEVRDLRVALTPVVEPSTRPASAETTGTVVPFPVRPSPSNDNADLDADVELQVDDGATPLLGRAFRAASPGELRRPGGSRGFAWLERGLSDLDVDAGGHDLRSEVRPAVAESSNCHTRPRD